MRNRVFCSLISLSAILFSQSCRENHRIVPGDMKTATQLIKDTTRARLFVLKDSSGTIATVVGKHWFAGIAGDSSTRLILDRRELDTKGIKIENDGSFTFILPEFSQPGRHTIEVIQYNQKKLWKSASFDFSIRSRHE